MNAEQDGSKSSSEPLVLIVDDAENVREGLAEFLRTQGFRVATARNGFEGVRLAAESMPNIILMDLGLPGMDGTEATRHLKRLAMTCAIPIVAFTGQTIVAELDRINKR